MTLFRRPSARSRAFNRVPRYSSAGAPDVAVNTVAPTPGNEHPKFDQWLQRLSHLAQCALCIFTIGTIYTTVIPLYQKTLLDEAIARKEIELKNITTLWDKAYKRVLVSTANDFVNTAVRECGFFPPLDRSPSAEKTSMFSGNVFETDINTCLQGNLKRIMARGELSPNDQAKFESVVNTLSSNLRKIELEAISQFRNVIVIAEKSPEKLPTPKLGTFEQEAENNLKKWNASLERLGIHQLAEVKRRREIDSAVRHEQNRIAREYSDDAIKKLVALREFNWAGG